MKLLYAAGVAFALAPTASGAAVTVQATIHATGYTTTYCEVPAPSCETITDTSPKTFIYNIELDGLQIGQVYEYAERGHNSENPVEFYYIRRTGRQTYEGFDFSLRKQAFYTPVEYRYQASSFSVVQTYPKPDMPAPVPEPATWAMMILGFGAVGYAMRRKTVLRFV